jgi:hypothetical protein
MSSLSTSFFLFLSCFLSFRLLLLQNALFWFVLIRNVINVAEKLVPCLHINLRKV